MSDFPGQDTRVSTTDHRPVERTLVFVDIETTGLDPLKGVILEFGCIITDSNLTEIARQNWVFKADSAWLESMGFVDQFVHDMHVKSGLWTECAGVLPGSDPTEEDIVSWLREHGIYAGDKHPICGNSVQFESRWLPIHLPMVYSVFGYRNIDISGIREAVLRFQPHFETAFPPPLKREIHRALPDLEDSIALMDHYRKYVLS